MTASADRPHDWPKVRLHVVTGKGGTGKSTVARALAAGVTGMVTICSDVQDLEAVAELARRHPEVWGTAGIHPHEARHGTPEAIERVRDALRAVADQLLAPAA